MWRPAAWGSSGIFGKAHTSTWHKSTRKDLLNQQAIYYEAPKVVRNGLEISAMNKIEILHK